MRKNHRLFNVIKGGIYHSTSITSYKRILTSGAITPNRGQFPFSHPQSKNSRCYLHGGISLLDIRDPKQALTGKTIWTNWTAFLDNHDPITLLLDIDPKALTKTLYDFDALSEKYPFQTMVAEAEKCYCEPIPTTAIQRCILVNAKDKRFFRIIKGNNVSDGDFQKAKHLFESKTQ